MSSTSKGAVPSNRGGDRLSARQMDQVRTVSLGGQILTAAFSSKDDSPLAWQDRALCRQTDPEAFYPEKGGSTREAKKVCSCCQVRAECLDYALDHDERFGVWGGLSERERIKLKRRIV